jgi:PAS domain S-box-containing protein
MKTTKNTILVIEDDLGLNELICEKINDSGYDTHCVTSANDAIVWLTENTPTLMIVDYSLGETTAKEFINSLKQSESALPPFVIATGQGDERIAVEMMKLGARDYVIKDTSLLQYLPLVIARILKDIENENLLLEAQRNVELTKQTYLDIFNTISEAIYILDEKFVFVDVNKGAEQMYQLEKNEIIGKSPADLSAPNKNDLQAVIILLDRVFKVGMSEKFEFWALRSNGEMFPKEVVVNKGTYFGQDVLIATARDITERKNFEAKLTKKVEELEYMNKFMINREVRMAEMKKEINELLVSMGQEKRYL